MNAEQKALYIRDHADEIAGFADRLLIMCEIENDSELKERFREFTRFCKKNNLQLVIHERNGEWL